MGDVTHYFGDQCPGGHYEETTVISTGTDDLLRLARERADFLEADNARLRDGIKTAKLVADTFGVEFTQWRKDGLSGSIRGLAIPEDCDRCEVTIDADVYEAMADLWDLIGDNRE